MLANSYVGIVDQEVPRLVVRRARRMRIPREEIDDLQQQIVPKLARFEYDEARSNGASHTTALIGVIDNQLKAHLRAKRRYERRIERLRAQSLAANRCRPVWPNHIVQPEPVDLRLDLAEVVATLSQRDQTVCRGLAQGHTKKAIAEQLGCGRDTVARAICRIREVFAKAGLQVWIDPDYAGEVGQ